MVLNPEKRQYWVKGTEKTETSIKMHHGANILVALGEDLGAGRWSVRIQIRPLVSFIWLAALIMAIGGAVAASDRRYRTARAAGTVPAGLATGDATTRTGSRCPSRSSRLRWAGRPTATRTAPGRA